MNMKQLMAIPDLDAHCSAHLKYRDLVECGETQSRTKFPNLPVELETYAAVQGLATHILDPVISKYGNIELTYGFGSTELVKRMLAPKRVAPKLDQHAAHERNAAGHSFATDWERHATSWSRAKTCEMSPNGSLTIRLLTVSISMEATNPYT